MGELSLRRTGKNIDTVAIANNDRMAIKGLGPNGWLDTTDTSITVYKDSIVTLSENSNYYIISGGAFVMQNSMGDLRAYRASTNMSTLYNN